MKKRKRPPSPNNALLEGMIAGFVGFFTLIAIMCVSSILIVVLIGVWRQYEKEQNRQDYLLNTVNKDVVTTTLCRNDAVPITIADCSDDNLQLQFWQVRDIAESYVEEGLTYSEVGDLIGDYEVSCNLADRQPLQNTFRCSYQFNVGYTLVFVFDDVTEQLLAIE